MITDYASFVETLLRAGFSMGGGSSDGIYSTIDWNWNETPPYDTPVRWHTGDIETDPWEWRMRVLNERSDIAYAKLFFRKSGFITQEWYPYFLAVRRQDKSFEETYSDGTISRTAADIYALFKKNDVLPLHEMKLLGGFTKENSAVFDRALTELQMRMFLTMCGRQQKISANGSEYGWSSTVFCTTERFFGEEVFNEARNMTDEFATTRILEQIHLLNPHADLRKATKFIRG